MDQKVLPPSGPSTALVLGAGFSRAASSVMPLTDTLGQRALATMAGEVNDAPEFSANGLTFETWLSWLAERQPADSEAEYLSARARFSALSTAIARELRAAEDRVRDVGVADWMAPLVDLAHWGQWDIVTMNYDTLVEDALRRSPRYDADNAVHVDDIVTGMPNSRGVFQAESSGYVDRATFRLHKLHGSTDWFAVPGDASGITLKRIENRSGPDNSYATRATIGGREVFIVPPTSAKGGYFDSPRTRFVWREGRRGLEQATRVVIMGYSLPLTDTAMTNLLARTLSSGQALKEITVVNVDPGPVVARLRALGVSGRIHTVAGADCVSQFVRGEEEAASGQLIAALLVRLLEAPDSPVAVGWEHGTWGAVSSVGHRNGGQILVLEVDRLDQPPGSIGRPPRADPEEYPPRTLTLSDILDPDSTPNQVVVHSDGCEWTIGALVSPPNNVDGDWVILRPLGNRPER